MFVRILYNFVVKNENVIVYQKKKKEKKNVIMKSLSCVPVIYML